MFPVYSYIQQVLASNTQTLCEGIDTINRCDPRLQGDYSIVAETENRELKDVN